LIEIKNIQKYFKDVKAVDDISLSISENEYLALLGPNGAGKTTLVEMIEGIQKPDKGSIKIKGLSWEHHSAELHNIIGLSLQETRFLDKINVYETLKLFSAFYNQKLSRIDEILELTKLTEKRKARVNKLSGGQRQRLAIGIALLNHPQLLLLDEPTTGLDPNARREIWEILKNLRKNYKTTMLLTTHYMEEAEFLCDRIIIMYNGKILMKGTLEELLTQNDLKNTMEFSFKNKIDKNLLNNFDINWTKPGIEGKFLMKDLQNDLTEFSKKIDKNNFKIKHLQAKAPTLDDLFVLLTGEQLIKN